jgi:VanZ family protein
MAVFALGPFWPPFMNANDKVLHVAAFGAFGWLAAGAYPDRPDRRWQVLVALALLALGVEVAQAVFTASRTASLADAGASFAGAAFGVALAAVRTPMWVSGLLLAVAGIGIQRFYYDVWPPISEALHRLI